MTADTRSHAYHLLGYAEAALERIALRLGATGGPHKGEIAEALASAEQALTVIRANLPTEPS